MLTLSNLEEVNVFGNVSVLEAQFIAMDWSTRSVSTKVW